MKENLQMEKEIDQKEIGKYMMIHIKILMRKKLKKKFKGKENI